MEDYPKNLLELESRFSTEEACCNYLFKLRWPKGFSCSKCKNQNVWFIKKRKVYQCTKCNSQISVTAGTIFQDTHKPLILWFRAIWYVTTSKIGASALNIKRILGFGSYRTAWTWIHKLRRAMVRPGRDKLFGKVEVDETYLGGLEEGLRGRKTEKRH